MTENEVVVRISKPVRDGPDWFCAWSIEGLKEPMEMRTGGVVAAQAWTLALDMIAARLKSERLEP